MSANFPRFLLFAGVAALAFVLVQPVHSGVTRYGVPLSLAIAWSGWVGISWASRLRNPVLCAPLVLVLPFLLPGKEMDRGKLRAVYLSELVGLTGTKYVWGGESRHGIDCSGLARRALRASLLHEGVSRGNSRAFRAWAEQWWYDTSAKAMSGGYRGFTASSGIMGTMDGLDTAALAPGDMAVTENGVHVLVHLGGGLWIHADPDSGHVIIGNNDMGLGRWRDSMVTIHRWSVLGPVDENPEALSTLLSSRPSL